MVVGGQTIKTTGLLHREKVPNLPHLAIRQLAEHWADNAYCLGGAIPERRT